MKRPVHQIEIAPKSRYEGEANPPRHVPKFAGTSTEQIYERLSRQFPVHDNSIYWDDVPYPSEPMVVIEGHKRYEVRFFAKHLHHATFLSPLFEQGEAWLTVNCNLKSNWSVLDAAQRPFTRTAGLTINPDILPE